MSWDKCWEIGQPASKTKQIYVDIQNKFQSVCIEYDEGQKEVCL